VSAEEILDQAYAPVAEAIEKEYAGAKASAENGVKIAKERALSQLTR
jgi:hypothetical protein